MVSLSVNNRHFKRWKGSKSVSRFQLACLTLLSQLHTLPTKDRTATTEQEGCRSRGLFWFEKYRVFNLKADRILIWVIYFLRFTSCYITQLTCIYSKCWKWCPFISVHLSTRFTMFLATFLSVLSFFLIIFAIALFTGACLLNFSKKLCLQWA